MTVFDEGGGGFMGGLWVDPSGDCGVDIQDEDRMEPSAHQFV
jgi:hypothetical protein